MAKFVLSAFADEAGVTPLEQIAALKENGIEFIEPRSFNGKGILELTDEELLEIKALLDENGIKVNSLGSPIGKYDITAPFETHLEAFGRALDVCEVLGTDKMRMFSFFVEQDKLGEHRDEVISRLRTMVKIAKERGVLLCHENESRIYGQMPNEVADIMDNVCGLGAIFDAANYRMNGADVTKGINATLKNLAYLHIKDAIFDTQEIVPAGEGEGRIAEVIDAVNAATDGVVYLTLEPHLFGFLAYKSIDDHELKGKYSFKNNREAFDFAVTALKKLLKENNYREESGIWTK